MTEEEQRELMIEWFHFNFEDPVNETPRDDGEYIYPWGGPFDAREQLGDKFGDLVSEDLIESVAEHVEQVGVTDWAPTGRGEFYDHPEPDEPDEPIQLALFPDEPNERYGSTEDHEARALAREAVEELREFLEAPRDIGPGHNHPPDEATEPEEIRELRPALQELAEELAKPNPTISVIKRWATPLRDALIASTRWGLKKIDKALDAAAAAAGGGGVVWLATHNDQLHKAFDAIVHWLDVVTTSPF
jgi:hypothetical protein